MSWKPRPVVGIAMAVLSFSLLARMVEPSWREVQFAGLQPTKVWSRLDDRMHRAWNRAAMFCDNLRLMYQIRSRLAEAADEQARQ